MINELKVGDKVVVVKDKPNHWNFIEDMEMFLRSTLTVNHIGHTSEDCTYVKVEENCHAWDECFIDWEATSKLNKPSKLSATITVVNPLVQIKNVIECQPFKYEYYSEGSFCVSLYESEVPITYYNGKLEFDPEICNTTLTRDMVEEVAKVMLIVEENLEFFLLKGE